MARGHGYTLRLVGTGDFNGDGKADVLWKADDKIGMRLVNGSAVVLASALTTTINPNNFALVAASR